MECINQEIKQYLYLFVNHCQNDWTEWIPLAEFCYNNHIYLSMGHLPFFLNYGWHPCKNSEPQITPITKSAKAFTKHIMWVYEDASVTLAKAVSTMKHYYNQHHSHAPKYKPGDLVYLKSLLSLYGFPVLETGWLLIGTLQNLRSSGYAGLPLEAPSCLVASTSDLPHHQPSSLPIPIVTPTTSTTATTPHPSRRLLWDESWGCAWWMHPLGAYRVFGEMERPPTWGKHLGTMSAPRRWTQN